MSLFTQSPTIEAAAIWSYDASLINAANSGSRAPFGTIGFIGNNYVGVRKCRRRPQPRRWQQLLVHRNFRRKNDGDQRAHGPEQLHDQRTARPITQTISDTLWFFSDTFNPLPPQPGYVGMSGAFLNPVHGYGYAQAQMDFNGSFGGPAGNVVSLHGPGLQWRISVHALRQVDDWPDPFKHHRAHRAARVHARPGRVDHLAVRL